MLYAWKCFSSLTEYFGEWNWKSISVSDDKGGKSVLLDEFPFSNGRDSKYLQHIEDFKN